MGVEVGVESRRRLLIRIKEMTTCGRRAWETGALDGGRSCTATDRGHVCEDADVRVSHVVMAVI